MEERDEEWKRGRRRLGGWRMRGARRQEEEEEGR
jgi:hypothetical protein